MPFDTSPAVCGHCCLNYDDATGDDNLFEIISMDHHYKFHGFSFEPLLAITSQLQSITVPFASYMLTLSKLTNGLFLHTSLHPSMLCLFIFTVYIPNAIFVCLFPKKACFFFIRAGKQLLLIWMSQNVHQNCLSFPY